MNAKITEKILLSWSGGKDCAMTLYELQRTGNYHISALLTTLTEDYTRVSMHGVRENLLDKQGQSLGLDIEKIYLDKNVTNQDYENIMRETLTLQKQKGISTVAFGDIFLAELKKYREEKLSIAGFKAVFPIWERNSKELAENFINIGFRAVVTCVDTKALDGKFVAREFDKKFLSELPAGVDPCGENGEFHTFVYDGPIFSSQISYERGEIVLRDNRFYFCDLIPI